MVDVEQAYEDDPKEFPESDIVVDQKLSQLPMCTCARCNSVKSQRDQPAKFKGYKRIGFKEANTMTEHQFFILPPGMKSFVLGLRQWSKFAFNPKVTPC